jgi:hypothetical protein
METAMLTKSKTLLALGVLSAVLLASANPTLAKQQHHPRAHAAYGAQAPWVGYRGYGSGPYAFDPSYRPAPNAEEPAHTYIPRALSPLESWDSYGQRWD